MAEYTLTPDERALIEARRKQQAERELAAREDAEIPNVLELSAAQYYALSAEKRAEIWQHACKVAHE